MSQDARDDLRVVECALAPNGLHSRVCLEPLREVGFRELPGGQCEKRCRCVDLGRSHPHAIQLHKQERIGRDETVAAFDGLRVVLRGIIAPISEAHFGIDER